MRQERTVQASLFDLFAEHEIGRELKAMSQWLDEHPALVGLAAEDLRRQGVTGDRATGPAGGVGVALRAAQAASPAELRGVGVPSGRLRLVPRLRAAAAVVDPEEVGAAQDHQRDPRRDLGSDQSILLASARQEKVEPGEVVRLDSTVTAALMHEPSDSSLLWDAVRVMARMLKAADALVGGGQSSGAIIGARPRSGRARSSIPAIGRTGSSITAS